MQPIVFQIFNSLNQSDYANGFEADVLIDEIDFTANILPFGDPNEALLRAAINNIIGVATKSSLELKNRVFKEGTISDRKFSDEMYILPSEEKL